MYNLRQKYRDLVFSANRNVSLRHFAIKRGLAMEDPKLQELLDFLDSLKNYEKEGVPDGAGTDTKEGFDLQRMERLIQLLGDPLSHYRVRLPGPEISASLLSCNCHYFFG